MPEDKEYTLEDFDNDILEALNAHSGENKGGAKRPNVIEMLKAQGKLEASKTKR